MEEDLFKKLIIENIESRYFQLDEDGLYICSNILDCISCRFYIVGSKECNISLTKMANGMRLEKNLWIKEIYPECFI